MKKIYTIEKTDRDDDMEFNVTTRAMDLWMAMTDILDELRSKCKYGEGDVAQFEEARTMVWNAISKRGLDPLFL